MVEVMTDKATVTISAPRAGKIDKLMSRSAAWCKVGDVLVVIQTGNGSRIGAPQLPAATAVGDIRESLPGTSYFGEKRASATAAPARRRAAAATTPRQPSRAAAPSPAAAVSGDARAGDRRARNGAHYFDEKPLATPATRKLARDLEVDLRRVPGTGPDGRVTREDVLASARRRSGGVAAPVARRATARARHAARAPEPRARAAQRSSAGTRVPFVGLRRRIAENMTLSKHTAAHFTFVEECDVDRADRAARAAAARRRGARRQAHLPAVRDQGGGRRAQEAPDPQQPLDTAEATSSCCTTATTSASPPRPSRAWSCR